MFLWVAKVEESSRGVQPRAASSSSSSSIEWLFRVMLHRCGEGTASERSRRDSSSRIVRARVSRRFSSNAALTFRIRGGSLGGGFGGSLEIGANLVQIATLRARGIFEEGGLTAARFRLVARLRPHARRFTSL